MDRVDTIDRAAIVRDCYRAYETGDRRVLEERLSDDFTFSSPVDVGLDRAGYFERCWPNAGQFQAFDVRRLVEHEDEVIISYVCTTVDGRRFCNTEVFTFRDGLIRAVEVYFGWNL